MASSSSTPESIDVEKMMKNLNLKEKVEESFQNSVTEAGASSSSLASKEEEDGIMEMKNLEIHETEEEEVSVVLVTPESDTQDEAAGSSLVSSKGKPESMVILKSYEGDTFEVEESIAMVSQTIKFMIEDFGTGNEMIPVPLTNISSEILEIVLEFLEKHAGEEEERDEDEKQELKKWDGEFVEELKEDHTTLFQMIRAADYLNAKCLLDVSCQACADLIKGMPPEEIRKFFNIKNDFTPEEEAEVRREHAWAFE